MLVSFSFFLFCQPWISSFQISKQNTCGSNYISTGWHCSKLSLYLQKHTQSLWMVSFSLVLSPFFLQLCSIISFAEITDFFFFLESWPLSLGLSGVWIVGMLVNWRSEGKTKPWSVAIGKEFACNAGDLGSTPGLGRSPGEGKSYPLQYFGLENSMSCLVHGVAKSGTWLSDLHFHFTFLVSVFPSSAVSSKLLMWRPGMWRSPCTCVLVSR